MNGEALIFLDFKFYGARELQTRSDTLDLLRDEDRWVTVESPVVMCTVAYPLPPEGIIAAAYDAVAIAQHKWNERLYGAGASRNQTVPVAIRTWTLGLLVGQGLAWREVDRIQDDVVFSEPISFQGFSEQRRELIKRVPEAERFLKQRLGTATQDG